MAHFKILTLVCLLLLISGICAVHKSKVRHVKRKVNTEQLGRTSSLHSAENFELNAGRSDSPGVFKGISRDSEGLWEANKQSLVSSVDQEAFALRAVFRDVLKMDAPLDPGSELPKTQLQVPRRLLDLYKELVYDNTHPIVVRGIPSQEENGKLSFPIYLPASERLVSAELHFWLPAISGTTLDLYDMQRNHSLGSIRLGKTHKPEWRSIHLTRQIRKIPKTGENTLGVIIDPLLLNHSPPIDGHQQSARAFLLLRAAADQIAPHPQLVHNMLLTADPKGRIISNVDASNRTKRSVDDNKLDDPWPVTDSGKWHRKARGCRRRHLQVSFETLGWSDWVLWPQTFTTNYCEGSCHYSDSRSGSGRVPKMTNHAALQSLVHSMRLAKVPEPSCVPEDLRPLAVLCRDSGGAVVLRSYPNMRVMSCGCR